MRSSCAFFFSAFRLFDMRFILIRMLIPAKHLDVSVGLSVAEDSVRFLCAVVVIPGTVGPMVRLYIDR